MVVMCRNRLLHLLFAFIALVILNLIYNGCQAHQEVKREPVGPGNAPEIFGEMVFVPAGEFWMGCEDKSDCYGLYIPYQKVYLDAFYIDKYEVTVKQYRECFLEGYCGYISEEEKKLFSHSETRHLCNWEHPERENHPMNCVTWPEAMRYCRSWAGKNLPTETQWEKAARGTNGRKNPWGNEEATCKFAVMNEPEIHKQKGCDKGITWPVGSKPLGVSPYGTMDMAGNVDEWALNSFDGTNYPIPEAPSKNEKGVNLRPVARGGSLIYQGKWFSYARHLAEDVDRPYFTGFRCAREP